MNFLLMNAMGELTLSNVESPAAVMQIAIEPYSHLGDGVSLDVRFFATETTITPESVKAELVFKDTVTGDQIYKFTGSLNTDETAVNSISAVIDATEEFKTFEINILDDLNFANAIQQSNAFNALSTLGRKYVPIPWSSDALESNINQVFDILTQQDVPPTRLAVAFTDNVPLFTELLRVADELNIRLIVELDPTLTIDQAVQIGNDLSPFDHRVMLIWNPTLSRPINAVGLNGKRTPRLAIGKILGEHALRDARTNTAGIPPLQDPIAGFDYPFKFTGMQKRGDIVLDDTARKRLANAQINVVERQSYRSGIRFILGDVLTANGDNTAILKLANSSDIAMFIDNSINAIVMRHLLKGMTTFIEDATKESKKFLEACTSKDRPLLVQSKELSGLFELSITPRADRPDDAVDVSLGYHPNGCTRAAYSNFAVSK
ncbi:hypothetical protein [Acinetobacter seifertii]|uniref:hypothetical protein n=1 Tax=Acinetobacter seifertii TaxID=1530123 RepID=UPI001908867B|nr:hypothetical protein [Acinetobacter seifertii]MBJ9425223.1 hypothetical protein [Acinetobacter seifertii]